MYNSSLKKFSVLREVAKLYSSKQGEGEGPSAMEQQQLRGENGSRDNNHGHQQQDERSLKQTAATAEAPWSNVYNLGDEGRRKDMIREEDKDVALMRIASLRPDDGAFIRRTTGKWTYAR